MSETVTNPNPAEVVADKKPVARPAVAKRKRKKSRKGLIVGIVLTVLVLVMVGLALTHHSDTAVAIDVEQVSHHTILQTVTATGTVDPATQIKISSEVSGEIVFLPVKEGDFVHKGQVLVRINPSTMEAQRDQAQAAILSNQARLAQATANALKAQQDFARTQELVNKKLGTAAEMNAAEAQVKVTKAEEDAARFSVQESQASARQVEQSINKTTIVAPMSGVVTKLNSKLGEKVVGAIQMTGTEIMTIADLSVIEAVVDVSETDVVQVAIGDTAEVEIDAIPNKKYIALVSQIANSPMQTVAAGGQDQVTNFEVRVRFVDPDQRFRPGMTATATIQTARHSNVLAVPIQSVTTRIKKDTTQEVEDPNAAKNVNAPKVVKDSRPEPVVFLQRGNKVYLQKVTTGIRDDKYIEITSGLKPEDVVVSGSYKAITTDLKDSSVIRVNVTDKAPAKPAAKGA